MATVGKNITLTACNGQHVNPETGEFEDFCDVIVGDMDVTRATRFLRRKYHDITIVVNNIEKETAFYQMDSLEFIKHATKTIKD